MTVTALVVAKAPVPGLAKTRLAATIGDAAAADRYLGHRFAMVNVWRSVGASADRTPIAVADARRGSVDHDAPRIARCRFRGRSRSGGAIVCTDQPIPYRRQANG